MAHRVPTHSSHGLNRARTSFTSDWSTDLYRERKAHERQAFPGGQAYVKAWAHSKGIGKLCVVMVWMDEVMTAAMGDGNDK